MSDFDKIMRTIECRLNRRCGQLRYQNREKCERLLLWMDASLVGVLTAQRLRHRK